MTVNNIIGPTARKIAQALSETNHEVWRRKFDGVGLLHLVECLSLGENKWYYEIRAVSSYFEYKLAGFCE